MKKPKLVVEKVTKRFGDLIAVNNVSFEVYEREIFTLLGPSGCGKTTTLRVIAGLEKPDSGKVFLNGKDITNLPPQDRNICLVFQEYAVFPHMSVYDNIAFGLKVRRHPIQEMREKVKEVAEKLELTHVLNEKAGSLSIGLQQRIAIGRCLAIEPEILLLDEPLTLADARIREIMRRELRRLQKELKITMIYVTHDQLEAMMISDRIAVMNKGRLMQVGTPEEIYDDPKNLFVAYFIGSPTMIFLEGTLRTEGYKLILEKDNTALDITKIAKVYSDIDRIVGQEIVLGIRPEDIKITAPEEGMLKGRITLFEVLGNNLVVHVNVADNVTVKALTPLTAKLEEGKEIGLVMNLKKLHIFNKKSGEKIILKRTI